ncbi:hypothetical protein H6G97_15035 [Nostoc flagelliforme FACHB-838]|uniref:DDE Tnp4 domain-containing protein n=1 Tax=Nostoc flagelliforme FACHB-838 TaxID=2692904 RepID=A0ABR8DRJ5_9NOSO|nr:transposase family protein [Nostoc flagelliforme]MBD2530820.1 hypothetical protein [Nostoc flagelliforme FACHB-838]
MTYSWVNGAISPHLNSNFYYSSKKKRHTLKAQLVVDQASGKILCTAYEVGHIHDFRLLKNTKVRFERCLRLATPTQLCLADKATKVSPNSTLLAAYPAIKPRGADLPTSQRQHNRLLARLRVVGEHISRRLKIFRILKEQYRNRRKRFGLRCNLIAGLLNYELALFS